MAPDQLSSDPGFLAAYGAVIRQAREEHGLDRTDFASAAGISYSYLSAIESGQKLPSIAVQDALAGAIGVEASDLLARANGEIETEPLPTEEPGAPMRTSYLIADASPMHGFAADRAMPMSASRASPGPLTTHPMTATRRGPAMSRVAR